MNAVGRNKALNALKIVFLSLLLLIYLIPFVVVCINSFKKNTEILDNPFSLPGNMDFSNYVSAMQTMDFFKAFGNTLLISVLSVLLIVVTSSMTAYFLARFNLKINKFIFICLVVSMIIPFQAVMIPLTSIFGGLGLLTTKASLIYIYIGSGAPLAVFLYHGFIVTGIPNALEEAALLDGCNQFQTFTRIVFPLLKNVTSTVFIIDTLWIWNDYLLPSLVLISPENRTLPLSTYAFYGSHSIDYGPLMASLILCVVPVILVFLAFQKNIINGVVAGAVKS